MIPILQLNTQYDEIQQELEEAVLSALRSTAYINGPEVKQFEEEFAAWQGVDEAVGVGSGTEALHLAIRALDLGPEDEVISPAFTFIASAGAIALAGAKPAFCDIDPCLFNMDPADLEKRIFVESRSDVPVDYFEILAEGTAAEMEYREAHQRQHQGYRGRSPLRSPRSDERDSGYRQKTQS